MPVQKPNFVGIGVAKAGTTTLYDVLKDHSQIYLPSIKETHFFDDPQYYNRGLDWYLQEYFSNVRGQKAIGEITPSYVFFPEIALKLKESFGPDLKLILFLRNPMKRAVSHYKMHYSRGNEKLSFSQAIQAESERMTGEFLSQARYSYIGRGYYSSQIEHYLKYFPREQIHIAIFEEIFADKEKAYREVMEFLEVPFEELNWEQQSNFSAVPRFKWINHLVYRSKLAQWIGTKILSPKTRQSIKHTLAMWNLKKGREDIEIDVDETSLYQQYYQEEIEKLESLLGRSLELWKPK